MKNIYLRELEVYLPARKINNDYIEKRIRERGFSIPNGIFKSKMGCDVRYFAEEDEQVSDMAVAAARKILDKFPKEEIDLLIFSAACSDLIEPATANIVLAKLQLSCPAFDVKNACNSVVNAIEIACALIRSGNYKNILIVSGEKPSDGIEYGPTDIESFKNLFASYSFGDGGAALLLGPTEEDKGFIYHKHQSFGEYWPLCTIKGGGSMFPHDASKLYFSGQTYELKEIFSELGPQFVLKCLKEAGVELASINKICTHQVSMTSYDTIANKLQISEDLIVKTFHLYGNTASVSVPLALYHALKEGSIKKGDLVMLLGMAAGINISVQLLKI
jgi:3-oxoacyl-(acyl-carrier-protein) synthase III